jgi:chorismate synthase
MPGNSIGQMLKVTTFGESHGEALGVIIDGMPGGIMIDLKQLKAELERRAPGRHPALTSRREPDEPEILSGIFEGKTLGTPITVLIRNTNQKSSDYEAFKHQYRPGHADKTTEYKYGIRDHRGGGRSSGRETVARVIAGYFAGLIIPSMSFYAWVERIGPFALISPPQDHLVNRGELNIPDEEISRKVSAYLLELKAKGDSAGGIIAVSIKNCPPGLGEPVFNKLKADLAQAMLSLPACYGFSLGEGFDFAHKTGQEISALPDSFGGMEGGISNGREIFFKLAFKAPSTIGEKAQSGRHDPCVLPRAVPVVEAMAKIIMADHFLRQSAYASFLP